MGYIYVAVFTGGCVVALLISVLFRWQRLMHQNKEIQKNERSRKAEVMENAVPVNKRKSRLRSEYLVADFISLLTGETKKGDALPGDHRMSSLRRQMSFLTTQRCHQQSSLKQKAVAENTLSNMKQTFADDTAPAGKQAVANCKAKAKGKSVQMHPAEQNDIITEHRELGDLEC